MRFQSPAGTFSAPPPPPAIAPLAVQMNWRTVSAPSGENRRLLWGGTFELYTLILSWNNIEHPGVLYIAHDILNLHLTHEGQLHLPLPAIHLETDSLWVQSNSTGGSYSVTIHFKELSHE